MAMAKAVAMAVAKAIIFETWNEIKMGSSIVESNSRPQDSFLKPS